MADLRTIIDDATRLANTVSAVLPGMGAVKNIGEIATKVLDVIDTLSAHPPTQDLAHAQQNMQQARETLAARVKVHAAETAANLRGGKG